jgi:hypothetical protein
MCRNVAEGGRRCPYHSTPEYRDKENARRREKYAFDKIRPGLVALFPDAPDRYSHKPDSPVLKEGAAWVESLTDEERIAVEDFARWDSNETNRYFYHEEFRKGIDEYNSVCYPFANPRIEDPAEEHERLVKHREKMMRRVELLDSALAKSKFEQPLAVYRGTKMEYTEEEQKNIPKMVKNRFPIGSTYVSPCFLSTSTNPTVGADFSGGETVVFEMLTKEGGSVRSIAKYEHEEEIILPRDKEFTVVGIKENVEFNTMKYTLEGKKLSDKTRTGFIVQMVEKE